MIIMRRIFLVLYGAFIINLLLDCNIIQGISQEKPKFIVKIPSPSDEASYVWNIINNIQFYTDNKYSLSLPNNEIIDKLIDKKKKGQLTKTDWEMFKTYFANNIYNEKDYSTAYKKVDSVLETADIAIDTFEKYKLKWNFFIPEEYTVLLTLYGAGGTYNAKNGTINLMTTKTGGFKRGANPLETIIHEAVHIGIENIIVNRFGLSHWMKERIVDKFVSYHFKKLCPDYTNQPNPDTSIDIILDDPEVWDTLPKSIELFISNRKSTNQSRQK